MRNPAGSTFLTQRRGRWSTHQVRPSVEFPCPSTIRGRGERKSSSPWRWSLGWYGLANESHENAVEHAEQAPAHEAVAESWCGPQAAGASRH